MSHESERWNKWRRSAAKPWRHQLRSVGHGLQRLVGPARVRLEWLRRAADPPARAASGARVAVTLTSYPPRFGTLALTLQSLLNQSQRADEVVLWLYAPDAARLPRAVTRLQAHGLRIGLCEADWRVYKKLIPALREAPGSVWVTADDDVYYPRDWLAGLLEGHRRHPDAVVCTRAHLVRFDAAGRPLPYRQWPKQTEDRGPQAPLFFAGNGGVLYPPGGLHPDATDAARFLALCPDADDIWQNWMARLQGTPIVRVGPVWEPLAWLGSQRVSLFKRNARGGGNDASVERMVAAYGSDCLRGTAPADAGV